MIDAATIALGSFRQRQDYRDVSVRDRWTVRVVNEWVSSVLPPLLEAVRVPGGVLDVGLEHLRTQDCGESHVWGQRLFERANSNCYLSNGVVLRAA